MNNITNATMEQLIKKRWSDVNYDLFNTFTLNEVEAIVRRKVNGLHDYKETTGKHKDNLAYRLYHEALELIEIANKEIGVPESD